MKYISFEDIENSRKILGLGNKISIVELKERYRELARKYHPDSCKEERKECEEKFKQIKKAYEILMEYLVIYKIPVNKEEYNKTKLSTPKDYFHKYFTDWWG